MHIYQSMSIVFSEAPSQTGARNLKLIASSLMKLASLSEARVRFKIVFFCLTFHYGRSSWKWKRMI